MESKHAGDDGKPGLGSTSPLPSSVNAGDRQRPLFPFNFDLSAEGDRRSRDAAEEKDRRVREADDRDRQSREQKAGLLPLQGLGQQTAAPPSKPGLGNTSPLPSSVNATDRSPFSFNFDVSAEGERRNRDAAEEKDRRVRELDDRDRQTKEQKAGLLPLQHKFVFWYTRRTPGVRIQFSYEDSMKKIAEFSTAEGFWSCYCHLTRASNLPNPTDFHLFKEGIRPLWEDTANRNGGKWIIRFKKLVSGRFWEDLVLAMIGDQLDYGDTVCGAVLSIRFGEDILSVWNRNAADNQAVMSLRDSIKRHLHLPVSYLMEYKPHDASLRDNSSFRNTWLRG